MAQVIQIKRRSATGAPGSLAAGEQAYSETDEALWIGKVSEAGVMGPYYGKPTLAQVTGYGATAGASISMADTHKVTNLVDGSAAQDAVTKSQLDAAVAGLDWQGSAEVRQYYGVLTIVEVDAATFAAGDTWQAEAGGTPSAGSSDLFNIGDIGEFDGTSHKIIVGHSSNKPPAGTRCVLTDDEAATNVDLDTSGDYTSPTDQGKIVDFDGSDTAGTLTQSLEGWAILIVGDGSVNENKGYTYNATDTSWPQFIGADVYSAGNGIAIASGVISADLGNGLTISGNDIVVKIDTSTGEQNTGTATDNPLVMSGDGIAVAVDGSTINCDGSDALQVNFNASAAGIEDSSGVRIKVKDTSVAIDGDGLYANLNGSGGLTVSSGLLVKRDTTGVATSGTTNCPLSLDSNGLNVAMDNSSIVLTGTALSVGLNGTGGLEDSSGLRVKTADDSLVLSGSGAALRVDTNAVRTSSGNQYSPLLVTASYGVNVCVDNSSIVIGSDPYRLEVGTIDGGTY